MPSPSLHRRGAFTLIELLVVIAIIAILIALLVPAVQQVREAAARSQCANNLKQIGLAVHNYHDVNHHLPPSRHQTVASWLVYILPYIEQQALYDQWKLTTYYFGQTAAAQQTPVPIYFCPSRRSASLSLPGTDYYTSPGVAPTATGACADYAGNIGPTGNDYYWVTPPCSGPLQNGTNTTSGAFQFGIPMAYITDGLSNTLLAGDKHVPLDHFGDFAYNDGGAYFYALFGPLRVAGQVPGGSAFPLARSPYDPTLEIFGSYHPGVCQFVLCDGSVRSVNNNISIAMLTNLASRNDGNSVSLDQ